MIVAGDHSGAVADTCTSDQEGRGVYNVQALNNSPSKMQYIMISTIIIFFIRQEKEKLINYAKPRILQMHIQRVTPIRNKQ